MSGEEGAGHVRTGEEFSWWNHNDRYVGHIDTRYDYRLCHIVFNLEAREREKKRKKKG